MSHSEWKTRFVFIITNDPLLFFSDRPRLTVNHNLTSLANWTAGVPIHLSCSVHCYPPATSYAWYRLENQTALSTSQNYTVQPQNPGTYYCTATNEMGPSKSEPVQLYANSVYKLFDSILVNNNTIISTVFGPISSFNIGKINAIHCIYNVCIVYLRFASSAK